MASVVASKVRYVGQVKPDAYTSATVSLGPCLHTNVNPNTNLKRP